MPSMIATLSPGVQSFRERVAYRARAGTIVRADERHVETRLLEDAGDRACCRCSTTRMPASLARLSTATSALESAGAMTMALTCCAIICSTRFDLLGEVGFVLDAVDDEVVSGGVRRLMRLAPSAIVAKNSFANDFMTSAMRGRPSAAGGAVACAPPVSVGGALQPASDNQARPVSARTMRDMAGMIGRANTTVDNATVLSYCSDMAVDDQRYAIGDLASLGGVSRRTVRYYVQEDLLPPPFGVGRGNHYGQEHLDQLRRVKALQEAGHTLDEIRRALVDGMPAVAPSRAPRLTRPAPLELRPFALETLPTRARRGTPRGGCLATADGGCAQ